MTELTVNDLFRIIGEDAVEIKGLRGMLQEAMKRLAEKDEQILELQKQIGADNGEPT